MSWDFIGTLQHCWDLWIGWAKQRWDHDLIRVLSIALLHLMVSTSTHGVGEIDRESEPEEAFCM